MTIKNYWEILDNKEVIDNAQEWFKELNGYYYSGSCEDNPLGQRMSDAQFSQLKIRCAKNYIKKIGE